MVYEIVVHELAVGELESIRAFDQRRILADIRELLTHQPAVPTRRRKCLIDMTPSFEHELPVWELRVGAYRVFLRCVQRKKNACTFGPCGAKKPRSERRISYE